MSTLALANTAFANTGAFTKTAAFRNTAGSVQEHPPNSPTSATSPIPHNKLPFFQRPFKRDVPVPFLKPAFANTLPSAFVNTAAFMNTSMGVSRHSVHEHTRSGTQFLRTLSFFTCSVHEHCVFSHLSKTRSSAYFHPFTFC